MLKNSQQLISELRYEVKDFKDTFQEKQFVIDINLKRRQLTSYQRLELGLELEKIEDPYQIVSQDRGDYELDSHGIVYLSIDRNRIAKPPMNSNNPIKSAKSGGTPIFVKEP